MSRSTLQLTRPLSPTLFLSLCLIAILLGAGELIIRQQRVRSILGIPSLGGRQLYFERQWHRLETLTAAGVKVDCFALGNSMILNSFDPQVFAQSYQSQSGQKLSCFNFGVDSLTPVGAEALSQILVDTYHPQLLIFGTDSRDFALPGESEENSVITDMAWIKYRLGDFNFKGWLIDHSYLVRYRSRLYSVLHFSNNKRTDTPENVFGFEPLDTVGDIRVPPDPNDDAYQIQYYFRVLANYTVQPENKAALAKILEQNTNIVVVEMPVPETFFTFFDNPTSEYESFLRALREITAQRQVLLLETTAQGLIPDDGWMDYSHVNTKGAELFSQWLGKQIGQAVVDGQLCGLTISK